MVPEGVTTVTAEAVKLVGSIALLNWTDSVETSVFRKPSGEKATTEGGVRSGFRVNESEVGAASELPARSATVAPTLTV